MNEAFHTLHFSFPETETEFNANSTISVISGLCLVTHFPPALWILLLAFESLLHHFHEIVEILNAMFLSVWIKECGTLSW